MEKKKQTTIYLTESDISNLRYIRVLRLMNKKEPTTTGIISEAITQLYDREREKERRSNADNKTG